MIQKHKIIKFGYFMMRQDNLLQERMYHIVIKEQRSFSCSVFAIRVLTLPNQTKVNSAEPKLPVLISSYIQICTYVAFSLLRILENSLQLDCNVFIMFVELADQLAKTERCRATITERFSGCQLSYLLFRLDCQVQGVAYTWERLTVY